MLSAFPGQARRLLRLLKSHPIVLGLGVITAICHSSVLQVAHSAESINVAAQSCGAIAEADSEYGRYTADQAFDGVIFQARQAPNVNRWHSAPDKSHPHWIWVRFHERARIEKVVIHRADLKDYPVDFVGEYSPDGGLTFVELFSVTNNSMTADQFSIEKRFKPKATDNFRLRILKCSHAEYPKSAQISELEVFGEFIGPYGLKSLSAPISHNILLRPSAMGTEMLSAVPQGVEFSSKWLRIAFATNRPAMTALSWDSLGEGKLTANFLKIGTNDGVQFIIPELFHDHSPAAPPRFETDGNVIRYWCVSGNVVCHWEARIEEKRIKLAAELSAGKPMVLRDLPAFHFPFDPSATPVAPLANPRPNATAPLPLLLHAADYGTLLVKSAADVDMVLSGQPGRRSFVRWDAYVRNFQMPRLLDGLFVMGTNDFRMEMELSVENCGPPPALTKNGAISSPGLAADMPPPPVLARSWLNVFQYRPDLAILANNPLSDNAALCMFIYTDPAVYTPTLPGGVEAINLARESLDRYFDGAGGYGVGREDAQPDTYPALLIAAWDVIRVTGDMNALRKWLPSLERIASKTIAQDHNGNGLPESTRSGVSGEVHGPTGNWWDQINFGHEDAYVCALSYRAFRGIADLERLAGNTSSATLYEQQADKIRTAYVATFLNPETGILAGWKDSQGKLHDYWFTFINGMAITYGLVPETLADSILDRFQAKFKEVGYSRFDLGLPGNLVPIRKSDYGIGAPGSPQREDGRDGFGVFENGGATAAYACFYIQALYQTGRRSEAERILVPMLESYATGKFQNGVGHGGEWRRWNGASSGYEGFLADSYYTQMALFTGRYGIAFGPAGFRLEKWSPLKGRTVPLGLKYMGRIINELR